MSNNYPYLETRRSKGLCLYCGKNPVEGRTMCDPCATRRGVKNRRHPKAVWLAVDWSRKDADIAKDLGVSASGVWYQRKKWEYYQRKGSSSGENS